MQLIVKIHPAEKTPESKRTMLYYIDDKFDHLPGNVRVISPETTLSAYLLFPYNDAGLMYTGILCLGMALNKVPVIMVGRSRYSDMKFTNYVTSKAEYRELIENVPPLKQGDIDQEKIFVYFIKSYVPRPFIYYNSFFDLGWKINSLDDLSQSKDKYLDHICNYIAEGGVFQNW